MELGKSQLWKIWKETTFIELCSFFIDLLTFELGKLCPGVEIFVSCFRPGERSFALKSCPRDKDFDGKKLVARGQPGGVVVTGQIDTCIKSILYIFLRFIQTKITLKSKRCDFAETKQLRRSRRDLMYMSHRHNIVQMGLCGCLAMSEDCLISL